MRANSLSICLVLSAYFLYIPHATPTPTPTTTTTTTLLRKDDRSRLVWSEYGDISAVKINNGVNGCYHLHFITMDPHSLFIPTYLYSQMVLFVNSGNGMLSWMEIDKDEYELQQLKLETGDIYTLQPQTVFYLQNNLAHDDLQDLQIYAIFSNGNQECGRVYAGVRDLVLRFDNTVLQATLDVSEEVIKELRGGETQPLIVQEQERKQEHKKNDFVSEVNPWVIRAFLRTRNYDVFALENKMETKKGKGKRKGKGKGKGKKDKKDKKKKDKEKKDKRKAYNIFKANRDVENHFGWSVTMNNEELDVLHKSNFSLSMVNLTQESIMGPHWNPTSEEITIVLSGQGMVQVVCPSVASEPDCTSSRFRVEEGDVFVVPRYHPKAHMSFTNKSFVFMRFTMTSENNSPQYLAGKNSVLQRLDKTLLVDSFDVRNTTLMDKVLSAKKEFVFLKCKSCAEDEEMLMGEEAERERVGGGGGWKAADIEAEMARREEQEMRRRWRKAEATAARTRKAAVESGDRE